jgi:hypothetical protein
VLTSLFPSRVYNDGGYMVRLRGANFVDPDTEFKVRGQNRVFFTEETSIGAVDPATDTPAFAVDFIDDRNLDVETPAFPTPAEGGDPYGVYVQTFVPSNEEETKFADLAQLSDQLLSITIDDIATAAIEILDIYPDQGPLAGGNEVEIAGTGFPEGVSLVDIDQGTVLRVSNMAEVLFAEAETTIEIPVTLFRNTTENAPTSISGDLNFDPNVLQPVLNPNTNRPEITGTDLLSDWYNQGVSASSTSGQVSFVVASLQGLPITTEDPAGVEPQQNPFPMFNFVFEVVGNPGEFTFLTWSDVAMADANAMAVPDTTAQGGFFNVGTEPITPPDPAQVFFGANQAMVTAAKQIKQAEVQYLTVIAPTGDAPKAVDVRVQDGTDPSIYGISRASDVYGEGEGGYRYTTNINVTDITPETSWIFGGVVAQIQGAGFMYSDVAKTNGTLPQVFFGDAEAEFPPMDQFPQTNDMLNVIVPPLGDAAPQAIDEDGMTTVDVRVVVPGGGQGGMDDEFIVKDGFTYVQWRQRDEARPGVSAPVMTTSFFLDTDAAVSQPAVLSNTNPTSADLNAVLDLPNFQENGSFAKSDGEKTVPATVFGLLRASLNPAIFATNLITDGSFVEDAWQFDMHLYSGHFPFEELDLSINTDEVPIALSFPTGMADLQVQDVTEGATSLLSIDTALDFTNFENPAFEVVRTNTDALILDFQSNVGPDEFAPTDGADTDQVTRLTTRIYSTTAYQVRTDVASPDVVADILGEKPVSVQGGDRVEIVGEGLAWPQAVVFGTVPADLGTIQSLTDAQGNELPREFGFSIEVPDGPEGEVDIAISVPGPAGTDVLTKQALRTVVIPRAVVFPAADGNLGRILLGLLAALIGLFAGGDSGDGGGPCFIATAAYGTPMADEIGVLRAVRDEVMLTNPVGTAMVDAYYRVSPAIADVVAQSPFLAGLVRVALTPVIFAAKVVLAAPQVSFGLVALLAALATLRLRRKGRTAS